MIGIGKYTGNASSSGAYINIDDGAFGAEDEQAYFYGGLSFSLPWSSLSEPCSYHTALAWATPSPPKGSLANAR